MQDLYDTMTEDSPEGQQYARPALLKQAIDKRAAQGQAFDRGDDIEETPEQRRLRESKFGRSWQSATARADASKQLDDVSKSSQRASRVQNSVSVTQPNTGAAPEISSSLQKEGSHEATGDPNVSMKDSDGGLEGEGGVKDLDLDTSVALGSQSVPGTGPSKRRGSRLIMSLSRSLSASKAIAKSIISGKKIDVSESKEKVHDQQLQMVREKIDVKDLENFGVEPRYARHLMHSCKMYLNSQVDFTDTRKTEMKQLLLQCNMLMENVDSRANVLQSRMSTLFDRIKGSFDESEMLVNDSQRYLVNKQKRYGLSTVQTAPRSECPFSTEVWNAGQRIEGVGQEEGGDEMDMTMTMNRG